MKKILSLALTVAMVCSMFVMPTFATETNDYTSGTQVEYVGTGTEEYMITVPALLSPGGSGTVTLSGTWASNKTVKVWADKTVTLTNSINSADQKILDVTFAGIEEAGSNVESQIFTETVSVAAISNALFGTWDGTFYYNVEMNEADVPELNEYGFYFNQPYVWTVEYEDYNEVCTFVFYEDGTYDGWFGCYPNGGICWVDYGVYVLDGNMMMVASYEQHYLNFTEVGVLSDDGTSFIYSDDSDVQFVCELSQHEIYYGDYYTIFFDNDVDGTSDGSMSLVFYDDGSVWMYEDYVFVDSLPAGSAIYDGFQIDMTDTMGLVLYASFDGTQIIIPGDERSLGYILTNVETESNAHGLYFNQPYVYTVEYEDYNEIVTVIFYEDGTISEYRDGFWVGNAVYVLDGNRIIVQGDDDAFELGVLSDDGTFFIYSGDDTGSQFVCELSQHEIYYGDCYTVSYEGFSRSLVFYDDGSVCLYEDYVFVGSLPAGSAIYDGFQIDMMDTIGLVLYASFDGTQIIIPGEDGYIFTHEDKSLFGPIQFDTPYICHIAEAGYCLDVASLILHADGSGELYGDGVLQMDFPADSISYTYEYISDAQTMAYVFELPVEREDGSLYGIFSSESTDEFAFGPYFGLRNYETFYTISSCTWAENGIVDGMVSVNNRHLLGYSGLENEQVVIPSTMVGEDGVMYSIKGIDFETFSDCDNIVSIVIPDSVIWIHDDFSDCTSLTDIYYQGTEESWNSIGFTGVIPESVTVHFNYTGE